jgi:hypothetical protein
MVATSTTVYAFYVIDNGWLDNSDSESWLYYQESTSDGVWSGRLLAWTAGPLPAEMFTPFPAVDSIDRVGVIVKRIDPTVPYPVLPGLSVYLLYYGGALVANRFDGFGGAELANALY